EAQVERAKQLGVDAGAIADIEARWKAAKPKPAIYVRPLFEEARKPKPDPKPKPAINADADVGPLEILVAPSVSAGTKPKVEAGFAEQLGEAITKPKPRAIEKPETKAAVPAPLGFTQSPAVAPPVAGGEVLELDPAAPFDNAQKLVSLRAW